MALTAKDVQTLREIFERVDSPADNSTIRRVFKEAEDHKARIASVKFKRGDLVQFTGKRGERITIQITDFLTKNVQGVELKTGMIWRVAPRVLSPVGAKVK